MRILAIIISVFWASHIWADVVEPTRTIRPGEIIGSDAVIIVDKTILGAATVNQVIGQEAKVALYPNRPIFPNDIGAPALVERNQIVEIFFETPLITMKTDGRALSRGAVGEWVRVINGASKKIIMGQVRSDGSILVNN